MISNMINFEILFLENNKIIYKDKELILLDIIDILPIQKMKLVFKEKNSDWRQGIILKTNGIFEIENQKIKNRILLWYDNSPEEQLIKIYSSNNQLIVYNVWDVGNGTIHYGHNGAAMHILSESNSEKIYTCNDGFPDDDINDLIFSISLL